MRFLNITILLLLGFSFWAQQKKVIDSQAYFEWKISSAEQISSTGALIVFQQEHYRANDTLVIIRKTDLKNPIKIGRASKASVDYKEHFVAFSIGIDYDTIRKLKIDEVNKKKWTKDTVGIYLVEKDSVLKFPKSMDFSVAEKGSEWVLIHRDDSYAKTPPKEVEKKCFLRKKKSEDKSREFKGSILTVLDVNSWISKDLPGVTSYALGKSDYAYIQTFKINDSIDSSYLYLANTNSTERVFSLQGEIVTPTFDEMGESLAFMASTDTGEYKLHKLYLYSVEEKKLRQIEDTLGGSLKPYQSVQSEGKLVFSKDGSKLYYQVGLKPKKPAKDTLTKDEQYRLDLWSWTDGRLQPQQLLSKSKDAKGSEDRVYFLEMHKTISVSDTLLESIRYAKNRNSNYVLLMDQIPYLKEMTWDFWYYDLYLVDLVSGKKTKLYEHFHGYDVSLSPSGDHLAYFETNDSSWYVMNTKTLAKESLTKPIDDQFYQKNHDVAERIGPDGSVYWLSGESAIAIESQTDFWIVPLNLAKPYRFTKGKENGMSYSYLELDEDEEYIDLTKGFYLKAVNAKTKAESIYRYGENGLESLVSLDAKINFIKKAKEGTAVMYQFMNFETAPDLHLTDDSFSKSVQITDLNPQQKKYNWGTVEFVNWKDYNGDSVRGLLYKPEDFDPTKKYPLLVYYYERYTDNYHLYYRPKPTASIIYPTEYVSSGYLVFIPDIAYELGHPAKSAYNAIMSGTDHLLKQYSCIDSTRMGLQGQSWGGYQTAQLITMTTRYKCAMAGAPVSNMFSAYGGIRWGSGLSRTFQYETGQSRIGKTIWEAPELYIENSPLFHLPKVETPLLIMHNDGDGAVPWYQGIELFNGLRRLQKPVWMLNYNDDNHNLMKDANRMDLSIRMKQFFDYYLLEKEQPEWMTEGIPAVNKEKLNY